MAVLTTAVISTVLQATSLLRQSQDGDAAQSETIIYLLLGGLLGIAYSLGTEKFIRAMANRHIFVRNAMLCLSAQVSLVGIAAVMLVARLIYNQSGRGLEGFDRVLGILIPFVVRADLVVDWARRVASALISVTTWTQSVVQMRRLLNRASWLHEVTLSEAVTEMLPEENASLGSDLLTAEQTLWTEDADSLVNISQVWEHFQKLGRVAAYAFVALVAALPAACIWVIYALYHTLKYAITGFCTLAIIYLVTIPLAFPCAGAVIAISAGLLCAVVTMSVIGTMIQFAVYWCTRMMYSIVRITLSQMWSGFPAVRVPHAHATVQTSVEQCESVIDKRGRKLKGMALLRALRKPEEAGAAMAVLGSQLPTELEFALASWDGKHKGHKSKPFGFSVSRHLISTNCFRQHIEEDDDEDDDEYDDEDDDEDEQEGDDSLERGDEEEDEDEDEDDDDDDGNGGVVVDEKAVHMARRQRHGAVHDDEQRGFSVVAIDDDEDADMKTASESLPCDQNEQPSLKNVTFTNNVSYDASTNNGIEQPALQTRTRSQSQQDYMRRILKRIGLDHSTKSSRRRRLSTFYALGMMVNLQIESGGNACCLHNVKKISDEDFMNRINALNSPVADEAVVAVQELSSRLRTSSRYQVVPTGPPHQQMVPVQHWLRSLLLLFLECS